MDTEVKPSENLVKLRQLVDRLDNEDVTSHTYQTTLKEIQKVIKEEKKIISGLKRNESKISHYENICTTILTLISTTNL